MLACLPAVLLSQQLPARLTGAFADQGLLEAFANLIKSQNAGQAAPQIMYIDAALPETTGTDKPCFAYTVPISCCSCCKAAFLHVCHSVSTIRASHFYLAILGSHSTYNADHQSINSIVGAAALSL